MGKLSATAVRQAKFTGTRRKLWDGDGLYLHVLSKTPVWRYDYQHQGRRRTMTLGPYPLLSLAEAREQHRAAMRILKVDRRDPVDVRQALAQAQAIEEGSELEAVAVEWLSRQTSWVESHRKKVILRLRNDVYPVLGHRPVGQITAAEVLDCLRVVEARGAVDSAHRIKQTLGGIFRYAIATGRSESDPTAALKGALASTVKRSYPHIIDPSRLGQVLKAIDGYDGSFSVVQALRLLPLVFVCPGELRGAQWSEFDLDRAVWTIPAKRMKRKVNGNHIVPLSKQAISILQELHPLTGHSELLFPGMRSVRRPISDNSLNAALRRLDIGQDEHVAHGFRHTASTLLNEARGFDPDVIEVQLHHADRTMRGKYNKARYFEERRKMMQAWADYLDGLKVGGTVIELAKIA